MKSIKNPSNQWEIIYNLLKKNSSMWELFTKKDEYFNKKLDKYERVKFKTSNRENILIPKVSEYLVKNKTQFNYKDGKKFAIFLSHDIDDIFISRKQVLRSFVPYPLHRYKLGFNKFITAYIKKQKPYLNFKEIIQIEKKYNATSSFFFLASENDVFGKKYNLESIKDEIFYIADQKCEIGLHTGFYNYDNLDFIKDEKEKLEKISQKKVVGVRNHTYRFKIPRTWNLLSQAGFEYDSTFGYYDALGFRNGMCHPFKPYDLNEKKAIDIIEISPCIVDVTLFSYMKFNAEKSWIYIKNLIDTVEKLGGVLTIIWHNWTFSFPVSYAGLFGKEWTKLYEKILEYGYKKNAWLSNGKNISDLIIKNY